MAAKKGPPRDSTTAEIDALFRLPLGEFTGARNALAARLKKEGHAEEAAAVKGLEKPSLAAWAVNQIYWADRKEFDGLVAATAGFRAAQAGRGDPRPLLEARREALVRLARKALDRLREAGARPGPETARRVTNTLEALATLSPATDLVPGRLTRDADPPGFEALAGGAVAGARGAAKASRVLPFRPAAKAPAPAKETARDRQRRAAEARESERAEREAQAAARRAIQEAEQALRAARRAAEQAARALAEAEKKSADAQAVAQARAEEARKLERAASSAAEAVAEAERRLDRARVPRRE